MTLVVPYLHNINMFMVLLIFALGNFKINAKKPILLDSGFPRGVRACVGMVVIIVSQLSGHYRTLGHFTDVRFCSII